MSADLRPVQSYINLEAIDAENREMVKRIKATVSEILAEYKKTKGIEIKLASDPASAKQIRKSVEELQAAQKKLQASTLELNKVRSEQIRQEGLSARASKEKALSTKAEAQATEASAKAKVQELKYTAALLKEKEKLAKQEEKSRKELEKSLNAYEQLKRKYTDAANTAKTLGAEVGTQSTEFKVASGEALKYWKQLDEIESAVGQAQRRVGQYERAQFSLNQVLREAPAFVNSLQTGFMAISNNLPMLSDEFSRLRQSGLTTFQSLKVFATGLFSVQTAISVGVTLLTAYGADLVDFLQNLSKSSTKFDSLKESQKILNEALKEGSGSYQDASKTVSELRVNIDLAKRGILDKKEVVKQYNETIGKTTGQVSSLDEAEKSLVKNGPAYVKMMLYKAAANLALEEAAKKATEAEKTRLQDIKEFDNLSGKLSRSLNSLGSLGSSPEAQKQAAENNKKAIGTLNEQSKERRKAAADALDSEGAALEKIANDFQTKAAEIATKFRFNFFPENTGSSPSAKFYEEELKSQAEAFKELSKGQDAYLLTRINARKKAFELERAIIEGNRSAELQNAGKDQREIFEINRKANFELKQLRENLYRDLYSIQVSYSERQKALETEINAEAVERFMSEEEALNKAKFETESKAFEKRANFLKQGRDIELSALEKNRAKGLVSEEEYQRQREKIETEYAALLLKAEIEYTEAVIQLAKLRGDDVSKQEADLAALKLELSRTVSESQIKDLKAVDKAEEELHNQKKKRYEELGKQVLELFSSIVTGAYDREKNQIQEQIEALEARKQKEIETANASIQNAQDKAAAITTIEARANAQKEQLEQRKRKIDQQKARFEKLASLLTVEIDTIQKIAMIKAQAALLLSNPATVAFAPVALSQIPIVIASGALAAASILAKPIPQYATGTMDHPGGPAVVGDGGRSELAVTPEGKLIVTPNVPTLMDLPEHSIVLPDMDKATSMLAKIAIRESITSNNLFARGGKKDKSPELQELVRIRKLLVDKPSIQQVLKDGELRTMVNNGSSWTEYINRNL